MARKLRLSDIEIAYIQAAKIVDRYGDVYLPIFERMEYELKEYRKKEEALKRAISVASSLENK